jgi:P4 family phage/plasmid primase-like protien
LAEARAWIEDLFPEQVQGQVNVVSADDWTGRFFARGDLGQLLTYVEELDDQGKAGIYVRMTTVRPGVTGRGTADDSEELVCLWGDIDFGTVGHKHQDLPPDEVSARKVVTAAGLPVPSVWVGSGGGLYPVWLLEEPVQVQEDHAALSVQLQQVLAGGARSLGFHYGTEVSDLARVLRLPGTVNRKTGPGRLCQVQDLGGPQYEVQELAGIVQRAWKALDKAGLIKSTARAELTEQDLGEAAAWLSEDEPCQATLKAQDKEHHPHRRKNTLAVQEALVRLGEQGHRGVMTALDTLESVFADGSSREPAVVHDDFWRMVKGAIAVIKAQGLTPDEDKGCCPEPAVSVDQLRKRFGREAGAGAEAGAEAGAGAAAEAGAEAAAEAGAKTVTLIKDGRLTDYRGRLLLVTPLEVKEQVETRHGVKDVCLADVVVLDGDGAPAKLPGLELTQRMIVGQLRPFIGKAEKVAGVLVKEPDRGEKSGAWRLDSDSLTEAQVDLALAYITAEKGGELVTKKTTRTTVRAIFKTGDDRFSDSRMAETVAREVLAERFIWVAGMRAWMTWTGKVWAEVPDKEVGDAIRKWALKKHTAAAEDLTTGQGDLDTLDGWRKMLEAPKQARVLGMAEGIVLRRADELDADPDLLNTPSGVVDLRTGRVLDHDPALMMTKITRGAYRPGFKHPDWTKAQEALPEKIRTWFQVRIGQAATGHPTPDDILVVLQGSGENGKTSLTSAGPVVALGDYGSVASHKLFQASRGSEHSTERADLRGRRLLIAEELTEGRALDITAVKQVIGTTRIKAHYMHKDNIEFDASHTLFVTSNYVPVVSEVDHGTWRRLALVRFPFTFRKPGEELTGKHDKSGDLELRDRIRLGRGGQHDAIVTWIVEGAVRWYADQAGTLALPAAVQGDTRDWRRDADRILGFWDEKLKKDEKFSIVTTELMNAFNTWLSENGHNKWSKETFHPRFSGHSETARYRVEKKRPKKVEVEKLSRPEQRYNHVDPLPVRPEVYENVRFRTAADDREPDDPKGGTDGTDPSVKPPKKPTYEENTNGSVPSVPPGQGPEPPARGDEVRPDPYAKARDRIALVRKAAGS